MDPDMSRREDGSPEDLFRYRQWKTETKQECGLGCCKSI